MVRSQSQEEPHCSVRLLGPWEPPAFRQWRVGLYRQRTKVQPKGFQRTPLVVFKSHKFILNLKVFLYKQSFWSEIIIFRPKYSTWALKKNQTSSDLWFKYSDSQMSQAVFPSLWRADLKDEVLSQAKLSWTVLNKLPLPHCSGNRTKWLSMSWNSFAFWNEGARRARVFYWASSCHCYSNTEHYCMHWETKQFNANSSALAETWRAYSQLVSTV